MSLPILTITLNPAIDQTVQLDHLATGRVNLASGVRHNAGGKGINVASCLADLGLSVMATGFLGQHNEPIFQELFAAKGIADHFIRLPGDTRINLKLVERDGANTTDINLPGFAVDECAMTQLGARVAALVQPGQQVALCGSVPSTLPATVWANAIGQLHTLGCEVLLDTSGAPLNHALDTNALSLPDIIKPNRHELEDWAGHALDSTDELLAAQEAARIGVVEDARQAG